MVIAYHAGDHTVVFPIVGAAACFLMRMAGLRYGIGLPAAADVAVTGMPRVRRGHAVDDDGHDSKVRSRLTAPPASSRPPLCRIGDLVVSRKACLAPVPHLEQGTIQRSARLGSFSS